MSEQEKPEQPATPRDGIPTELIDQVHKANEHLTHARRHMDAAINANTDSLAQREQASHEVGDAEKEFEKLDQKIGKELEAKKPRVKD